MIKNKTNQSTLKLLFFLSVIIILIVISFIIDFFNIKTMKKIDQNKIATTEKYLPSPIATPTLGINSFTVYNLTIKPKKDDKFSFENFIFLFANPNIRSFETTDQAYTDSFRIYSTPQTTDSNHQYLLMTLKEINLKSLYENEQYLVTITPNSSININYLYDNKYCQSNSDCLINTYLCTYGTFNKYERIRTSYGCEGNIYDLQNNYYFGPHDKNLNCNSQVIYQGTRCINHQCIGQNRTIKCIGEYSEHP